MQNILLSRPLAGVTAGRGDTYFSADKINYTKGYQEMRTVAGCVNE